MKEYKRNQALGRGTFCSRNCTGSYRGCKDRPEKYRTAYWSAFYNLRRLTNKNSTQKKRVMKHTLDPLVLEKLYRKQKGICALSGVKLHLPTKRDPKNNRLDAISVDRIDSAKDYTPCNIQLVLRMVNYAKNQYTNDEFIEMCKATAAYHSTNP